MMNSFFRRYYEMCGNYFNDMFNVPTKFALLVIVPMILLLSDSNNFE